VAPTGPIRTLAPWGPFGFTWENLNQWDRFLQSAAAEFGDGTTPRIPDLDPAILGSVMKAMMAIESGGKMYDANGEVIARDDHLGQGLSVGLLQVKPSIWGHLARQIGADPYDPLGNIRLATAIMADAIDSFASWEGALTRVFFPRNDPNGTTQNEYVTTVRGLIHEMGAFDGAGGPTLSPFPTERDFHVRPDVHASGRRGPSRRAVWVRDFGPGEAVTCDGVFTAEAVQGDPRWLRSSDPEHLAIHASAFIEAIEAIAPPALVGVAEAAARSHDDNSTRRWVATTTSTKLRERPRGDVIRTLPANTRLRVTGGPDHGFLPVALPDEHVRGWVDRQDVVRVGETDPGTGGTVPPAPPPDSGDVGDRIAAEARQYIGRRYVPATHGPDTFDCSGLVHWVVLQVTGQDISLDSHAQLNLGSPVARNQLQPGDLAFYDTQGGAEEREGNTASHVGIITGNGQMVNALNEESGVVTSDPFSAYFAPLYLGARRLA